MRLFIVKDKTLKLKFRYKDWKKFKFFQKNRILEISVYLLTVPSEPASKGIIGTWALVYRPTWEGGICKAIKMPLRPQKNYP